MFFYCIDYTNKTQYYFSRPQSWVFWALIDLHDYMMFFLLNILLIVVVFIYISLKYQQSIFKDVYIVKSYIEYKLEKFNHAPLLEFFWTVIPTILLFIMGWPSFKVLYAMEQLIDPFHTIIIIGNQWYWTYQYSDFDVVSDIIIQLDSTKNLSEILNVSAALLITDIDSINQVFSSKEFIQELAKYLRKFEESKIIYDCVIIADENLPLGYPRLLSTDQVLILPANICIRLLITSSDVIHSWALPSHGIKMDAIPGRVNQVSFLGLNWGTYWGQCSELCGINHGFMPIEVRILPLADYLAYISLNISFRYDKLIPIVEQFTVSFIKYKLEKSKEIRFLRNFEYDA